MKVTWNFGEFLSARSVAGETIIKLAKQYPNVYFEPSWLNVLSVKQVVEILGAERMMYSSDMPLNIEPELAKYRTAISDPVQLARALAGTAIEVFRLPITSVEKGL